MTRPDNYGRVLSTRQWQGSRRRRRRWWSFRPWLFLVVLLGLIWAWRTQFGTPEPAPPDASSELVTPPFTVCGLGRATNCVVDGDTVKLGGRSIRLIGIDAPEIHPPRCQEEARLGLAARDRLVALTNQGPMFLTGPQPLAHDDYGRELHNLVRVRTDGSVQSLADDLVASKLVRSYPGGPRLPWC